MHKFPRFAFKLNLRRYVMESSLVRPASAPPGAKRKLKRKKKVMQPQPTWGAPAPPPARGESPRGPEPSVLAPTSRGNTPGPRGSVGQEKLLVDQLTRALSSLEAGAYTRPLFSST